MPTVVLPRLNAPRRVFAALSEAVDRITVLAASALLVALAATMFVGVIYRYVLNNALPWTEEVAQISMTWLVFLGAVVLYRRGGHPAIGVAVRGLPANLRAPVDFAKDALIGIYLVVLTGAGVALASTPQPHTPALGISYAMLYVSIPVSGILMLVHWLRDAAEKTTMHASVLIMLVAIVSAGILAMPRDALQAVPAGAIWLLLPVLFALAVPIAVTLGLTSMCALAVTGVPLSIVAQRLYAGIDNPAFLAIPAFMLTGTLMESSGISAKLVAFASAIVGRLRGGLAHADVVASVLFADTSGSAVADTAAIGTVMMPCMRERGYDEGFLVAHQAASGSLGTLFPPSISMIIFATVTSVSVTGLFLASLIPGFLVAATYMLIAYLIARQRGYPREHHVSLRSFGAITLRGLPSLIAPVIVLGGILGGIFTPYEAGAVAAVYVAVIALFSPHRGKTYIDGILGGVKTASMVMFIIANASIVAWVMIGSGVPQSVAGAVSSTTTNAIAILVMICLLLVALAIFLEPPAILIAVIPICLPIIQNAGIAPLHFGVVVMLTTAIGMLLPPIGITLIVSASILGTPIERAARSVVPYVAAVGIDLLIVIFFPQITNWLPAVLHH